MAASGKNSGEHKQQQETEGNNLGDMFGLEGVSQQTTGSQQKVKERKVAEQEYDAVDFDEIPGGHGRSDQDLTPMHYLAWAYERNPIATKAHLDRSFASGATYTAIIMSQAGSLKKKWQEVAEAWCGGKFHLINIGKEIMDRRKLRNENQNVSDGTVRIIGILENDPDYQLPLFDPQHLSRIDKMVSVISDGTSKNAGVGSDKVTQQRSQQDSALARVCTHVGIGGCSTGIVLSPSAARLFRNIRGIATVAQRTDALHRAIDQWRGDNGIHTLYRQFGPLLIGLLARFEVKCRIIRKDFAETIGHVLDPAVLSTPNVLKDIDNIFGFSAREFIIMCLTLARLHHDHANEKEGCPVGIGRLAHEIEVVHNYLDRLFFEEPGTQAFIAMTASFNENGAEKASPIHNRFLLKASPTSDPKYGVMYEWARVAGLSDAGKCVEMRATLENLSKALTPTLFVDDNETLFSSKAKPDTIASTTSKSSSEQQQQQPSNAQMIQLTSVIAGLDKTLKNTTASTNTGATSGGSSKRTSVSTASSTNSAATLMGQRRERELYCANHPHANSHSTEDCNWNIKN